VQIEDSQYVKTCIAFRNYKCSNVNVSYLSLKMFLSSIMSTHFTFLLRKYTFACSKQQQQQQQQTNKQTKKNKRQKEKNKRKR
jgi:hypothetical protein